jgi:hypothetical protein
VAYATQKATKQSTLSGNTSGCLPQRAAPRSPPRPFPGGKWHYGNLSSLLVRDHKSIGHLCLAGLDGIAEDVTAASNASRLVRQVCPLWVLNQFVAVLKMEKEARHLMLDYAIWRPN